MLISRSKILCIALACGISLILLSTFTTSTKKESPNKMPTIEGHELYSVAIGRYSAKIHKNMKLTDATISKNGIPVKVYFNYVKQRAERLVDSAWTDIKSGESNRKDQEKKAEISQPSEDTWLIAYNFEHLIGPDVFGKPRNKLLNSSLGFAWKTTFY